MMAAGRPTDYNPDYCQIMIDYFSVPHYEGEGKEKEGAEFPQFTAFARTIGVSRSTLHLWSQTHQEFSDAYSICKELQEELLVNNSLKNRYNPYFAQFVLKNGHGYKDKQEVESTNKNIEIKIDSDETNV
jgi:hypothetical protein